MTTGKKYDTGKLHGLALIPPEARIASAHVLAYGEIKYGAPSGWRDVENALARYIDARDRHQLAIDRGEVYDPESGLPHSWHVLTNQMFIVALEFECDNPYRVFVSPPQGLPPAPPLARAVLWARERLALPAGSGK